MSQGNLLYSLKINVSSSEFGQINSSNVGAGIGSRSMLVRVVYIYHDRFMTCLVQTNTEAMHACSTNAFSKLISKDHKMEKEYRMTEPPCLPL